MDYQYQYLIENKNMFSNLLYSIFVPKIYEGIEIMFNNAQNISRKLEEKNIKKHNQYDIFKMYAENIRKLNNQEIEAEYRKIKNSYIHPELFDNVIKCTFKSYGMFMTYPDPKYLSNDTYNNISYKDFIHKCYIEATEYFINNPEILSKLNRKEKIYEIIQTCIENAVKLSLPLEDIMKKYMENEISVAKQDNPKEYIKEEVENQINKILNVTNDREKFKDEIYKKNENKQVFVSDKEEEEISIHGGMSSDNKSKEVSEKATDDDDNHSKVSNSSKEKYSEDSEPSSSSDTSPINSVSSSSVSSVSVDKFSDDEEEEEEEKVVNKIDPKRVNKNNKDENMEKYFVDLIKSV